jgi:hypothetical protein
MESKLFVGEHWFKGENIQRYQGLFANEQQKVDTSFGARNMGVWECLMLGRWECDKVSTMGCSLTSNLLSLEFFYQWTID